MIRIVRSKRRRLVSNLPKHRHKRSILWNIKYSNGVSDDLKYFYQVQVDDNHNCIVLKEGKVRQRWKHRQRDAEIEWLTQ